MSVCLRRLVLGSRAVVLGSLAVVCSVPSSALAADKPGAPIGAAPGTVVRWTAPGTTRCSMHGHAWAALQETCYYPIDLLQRPGVIAVTRVISGHRELARIAVGDFPYATEQIDLPDIPQANPSAQDLKRNSRDQALLGRVWTRAEGPAEFTLPVGPPVRPLPEARSFGVKRILNGKPAAQPHTGIDYATSAGSAVLAAADGTVVVAADLFFPGNAVFIDHGNGLVTMYFHLSQIQVEAGQKVVKGHPIGLVGSTGRSTGPHLFFGVRWHDARIDPKFLLEAPGEIPSVDEPSALPGHPVASARVPSSQTRKR